MDGTHDEHELDVLAQSDEHELHQSQSHGGAGGGGSHGDGTAHGWQQVRRGLAQRISLHRSPKCLRERVTTCVTR